MSNNLTKQILRLNSKPTKDLQEMYTKLHHNNANINSKQQLIREIAYRLQELEYGFLSEKHARKLDSVADDLAKGKTFNEASYFKPVNGTRICKEYHGTKYEVEAAENGFVCNGLYYKSLSALATKITGNRTNGPKFFGIKK